MQVPIRQFSLYDELGRVAAHVDANGNQRVYTYLDHATRIEVKEPNGQVTLFWTQNFDDLGRNIGTTDALGNSTNLKLQ